MLTGCGTAAEETAVIENSADESSIEAVPVVESKEDTTEEVREYPEEEISEYIHCGRDTLEEARQRTRS